MIVADASFLVAAFLSEDAHYDQSARLWRRIVREQIPVKTPVLALVEIAGAIVRRTGNESLAADLVKYLQEEPALTLASLSGASAAESVRVAISCRLRGGDAVYVALARQENAPLVTLDAELLQRAASAALVVTPDDWLRQNIADDMT